MNNRRAVVIGWLAVAILTTALATAVGRNYATNFSLPGTEAQRAQNLLTREFSQQSGDVDTVVWHASRGTVHAPAIQERITSLLHRARRMPHVVGIASPYGPRGALQISRDERTAFAVVSYDKRGNLLPDSTGKPLLAAINAVKVPGLRVAAGGQVIENAEGFSVGPATAVGTLAALVILLITFGSLIAAGMPLITAAFGLITAVALIGLATHITSMSNVAPELALMIGLGVGIDYALFIVTRFRESYGRLGDTQAAVLEAMDTSGRAILLAGTTVVIALLGMFATGVTFLYGMSIASVFAVLLTMVASLTLLPAMLSRWGPRIARPSRRARRREAAGRAPRESLWLRWSLLVQSRPWPLAIAALLVTVACLVPIVSLRLDNGDAGNDPTNTNTYEAFSLLSHGFGPGFNGPLSVVVELPRPGDTSALPALTAAVAGAPDVVAVNRPGLSPSGRIAVIRAYPGSAPQDRATTDLVNHLRQDVLPPLERRTGTHVLVGGFTAGSIDFAAVLSSKLPVFIAIVVVLSALLLFVMFRSLVIPIQAALMNLLSIGGALGATVLVFQSGWGASLLGIQQGPIDPWIPVLMFAVVFGLSMDYEVFLVSRVREEWVRKRDATRAVAEGIAHTGRVITAAAAIMVCVFLSFMLGDQRAIKEFGFGLASAVFLDAVVVRCVLLPAVLELLGALTWKLPSWIDRRLPQLNIEGGAVLELTEPVADEEAQEPERDSASVAP
ncbi:MAG TPA: MMPL family transporter [Solirubrobacteraceae bacterium]